jgi:hypothetical protein
MRMRSASLPSNRLRIARAAGACALALGAASGASPAERPAPQAEQKAGCLPRGDGYVKARVAGSFDAELDWRDQEMECAGAVRPDGGVRMRFSGLEASGGRLVLVLGIGALREGRNARLLPVNVTLMREGKGEFYSTQGEDKCMLDEVRQEPLVGVPHRSRSYRVVARGACTEPARAVRGHGAVLLSRFDVAGRIDFETEDAATDAELTAKSP